MDSLDLKPTLGSMGSDKEPLVGLFICLLVRWVSILPSFSYHSLRAAHQAPGKGLSVREDVVGKTLGESLLLQMSSIAKRGVWWEVWLFLVFVHLAEFFCLPVGA